MHVEVLPVDAWADVVAADLAATLGRPGGARVCLPTGSTPAPVYERVPAALASLKMDAVASTVILLDEYIGLARDDPIRAATQLRTQLLDRLDPAPAFVSFPVDGLAPADAACVVDAVAKQGLDLAVVGLGLNGHIGMNEPGSGPNAPTRVVELAAATARVAVESYGSAIRPTAGVTLGMNRLLAATELWLLVSGTAKATILKDVLTGPIREERPASFLRRHPRLRVIADAAAAGSLPSELQLGEGEDDQKDGWHGFGPIL